MAGSYTMGNLWLRCEIYTARNWNSIYKSVMDLGKEGIITVDVNSAFGDPHARDELSMLLPLETALELQRSRERPKSAPYIRLANSKRTSKYSFLQ